MTVYLFPHESSARQWREWHEGDPGDVFSVFDGPELYDRIRNAWSRGSEVEVSQDGPPDDSDAPRNGLRVSSTAPLGPRNEAGADHVLLKIADKE